ncbi:hypothetical protein [Photobacterium damselae]|uniref:hypothetical protein n=1 Tax=Photobacterium damselae TaxID=38293 RepID=UPI0022095E2E|nr:hypothetical protein [Photobacterium damselae]ELI6448133.1 hypothetical protein [Photobacterium damselae]BDR36322.1 hypothetical protein PDY_33700 [Photobacterium damselae subsp. damselae]
MGRENILISSLSPKVIESLPKTVVVNIEYGLFVLPRSLRVKYGYLIQGGCRVPIDNLKVVDNNRFTVFSFDIPKSLDRGGEFKVVLEFEAAYNRHIVLYSRDCLSLNVQPLLILHSITPNEIDKKQLPKTLFNLSGMGLDVLFKHSTLELDICSIPIKVVTASHAQAWVQFKSETDIPGGLYRFVAKLENGTVLRTKASLFITDAS